MFKENESGVPNRESIQQRLMVLEQEIARKDAAGETGPDLDKLHAEYEDLQEQLKTTDHQDLQKAA